jgi:hypothetical protein
VNRKDAEANIFPGGFLGSDNIGVFDRIAPLPTGGTSSSRTARAGWACTRSTAGHRARAGAGRSVRGRREQVLRALPVHRPRHASSRGEAGDQPWREADGFYYDVLHAGRSEPIPCAVPLHGRADPARSPSRPLEPDKVGPPARASSAACSGSSRTAGPGGPHR